MSDEISCSRIRYNPTYSSSLPPLGLDGGPAEVRLSFMVKDVLEIDTVGLKFSAHFFIVAGWVDPRLRFSNLRPGLFFPNELSEQDLGNVRTLRYCCSHFIIF